MRALWALALMPAMAQAEATECEDVLMAIHGFAPSIQSSGAVALSADGWCEMRDLRMGAPEDPSGARIDRLRWRGEGLGAFVGGAGLPTALDVEVEGLRIVPVAGDALLDWALTAQARPNGIDGQLSLAWDAPSHEVRLTDLTLDLPGENSIEATATLAGVDLTTEATAQISLGSMALTEAEVRVEMNGLFEAHLLLPLAQALLGGSPDPAREVEGLKGLVAAEIAKLPTTIFPDPSRDDLATLLSELPNPAGTLTLSLDIEAGGGIGPARFAVFALVGVPRSPAELWPALDGVTIGAGWAPTPALARAP